MGSTTASSPLLKTLMINTSWWVVHQHNGAFHIATFACAALYCTAKLWVAEPMGSCPATRCPAMPCPAMPCPALPCPAMLCPDSHRPWCISAAECIFTRDAACQGLLPRYLEIVEEWSEHRWSTAQSAGRRICKHTMGHWCV